jgi:hypothetical protein
VSRGFEFQGAEIEVLQDRAFDEGDVLDILERDGFFGRDQDAFRWSWLS